ncbi:MAG TPA: cupin domain-containing protein [Solirubrobacteraceae bacterium]|nr:cupin domain-containing protein [Solirubrobacteraceae bacterium]
MSYTVVNLKEVEDLAPRFGLAPNVESRFAKGALQLENFGLSYFRLAPGFREPFGHRHREQEEVYVVVSGSARMKVEDEIVELSAWDAIRVPAHAARCPEAGPNGAELIVVGAPLTDRSDTELLQDWWTE